MVLACCQIACRVEVIALAEVETCEDDPTASTRVGVDGLVVLQRPHHVRLYPFLNVSRLPHIEVLRQHLLLGVLGAGGGFVQSLAVVGGLDGGAYRAVHLLEQFGVVELRQVVGQLRLVELEQEGAPVVFGRAAGLSEGVLHLAHQRCFHLLQLGLVGAFFYAAGGGGVQQQLFTTRTR